MKKFYIAIFIILIIFLFLIILLINLLSPKKSIVENINIAPSPSSEYDYGTRINRLPTLKPGINTITVTPAKPQSEPELQDLLKKVNILSNEDLKKLEILKNILPYENADFAITYSPILNKFLITKKTDQALDKFQAWSKENDLGSLIDNNDLFLIINQPAEDYTNKVGNTYQDNQDRILSEEQKKADQETPGFMLTPYIEPPKNISSDTGDNLLNELFTTTADFLSIVFDSEYYKKIAVKSEKSIEPTSPPSSSDTSTSLAAILNEASQKVDVPERILEAVLKIESPSTLSLSPDEIRSYSTPGAVIPGCGPNYCSAAGPMQMTIGIDNKGNTSCPACGAGFCPNAWATYGTSVNTYGQYAHSSNPCNLKDNIYAAALKLKKDSGAADANNWTQDQVYRAARSYYGSCDDKYRYSRLGNRTYCEYVWWYYKSSATTQSGTLQSVLSWTEKLNINLEKGSVDPAYYNRLVNTIENGGYRATYREGRDNGVGSSGTYWCTNSVIDAYNLAGIRGLGPNQQSVISMRTYWMGNSSYKYKAYLNSDKAKTLSEIQPGCAVFFELSPGKHTGYEHVAVIKSISLDSNQNGVMETYDSNSVVKATRYPIYGADIKNTPLKEYLVGFGCL